MNGDEPQGTPESRLAAILAQQSGSPEDRLAAIIAQQRLAKLHADYQSGALQRRNAILNRNDEGAARDAAAADTYGDRLGAMAIRAAGNLPLGSTAMAATRAAITGEPMDQAATANAADASEAAQSLVRNHMGVTIPRGVPLFGGSSITAADVLPGAAGFRALLRAAPGLGDIAGGATYAGAVRASDALPEPPLSRAIGTLVAAGAGAAIPAAGKVGEMAELRTRAGRVPTFDEMQTAQSASRGAAADKAFTEFRNAGDLGSSPALENIIGSDSRPGVGTIEAAMSAARRENSTLRDASPTDARLLLRTYQIANDAAWRKANGFSAGTGVHELADAIEPLANAKGVSLKGANAAFSEPSGVMDARERGYRTMQYAAAPRGAPPGQALGNSPAQLPSFMRSATPAEQQGAIEGALARLQGEPTFQGAAFGGALPQWARLLPKPSRAMNQAPDVLRTLGAPTVRTQIQDAITRDKSPTVGSAIQRVLDWASPSDPTPPAPARGALAGGAYDLPGPSVPPPIRGRLGSGAPKLLPASAEEQAAADWARQVVAGRRAVETEPPTATSGALSAFSDWLKEGRRRADMTPSQRRALDWLLTRGTQ